jgi:hypothetical protein
VTLLQSLFDTANWCQGFISKLRDCSVCRSLYARWSRSSAPGFVSVLVYDRKLRIVNGVSCFIMSPEKLPNLPCCCPCRCCETLRTAATNGPIIHPPDDISFWNHGGRILTGENRTVPVPHTPPNIPHVLTRAFYLPVTSRKSAPKYRFLCDFSLYSKYFETILWVNNSKRIGIWQSLIHFPCQSFSSVQGCLLMLRGGIVQSVPYTADNFWSIMRPHMSSNQSWFIQQCSLVSGDI